LARKKKSFDIGKEVKAIARERVGRIPAEDHPAEIAAQEAQA